MFYVVGNGPSLRKSDIKNLPSKEWLGMNSAYRYWDTIGKYPRYYACLDPVVVQSHAKEILRLHRENLIEEFFLHEDILKEIPQFKNDARVCLLSDFLEHQDRKLPMSRFALYKQTTGALATRFCIEKGLKNLCLIGVDCNYVELIDEAENLGGYDLVINKKVSSNPNYFFDDYQAQGDKYQVPNPRVHSGNLHLQSFVAIANDIAAVGNDTYISVGSTKSMLSKYNIFPTKPIRELMGLRRVECVAIPIIKNEVDIFLENLELWTKPKLSPSLYNSETGTVLHVFLDGSYDQKIFDDISTKWDQLPELGSYFSEFKITFFNFPDSINFYRKGTPDKIEFCTKSGPNIFFLSVMKHCSQYEYTFQMESDCIPLKAGWLDGADRLIKSDGENAWFHGPNYYGPTAIDSAYDLHINGNGIYATGSNEFQTFLDNEYQTLLKYIISSGVNHMAYDTVMSFVFSANSANVHKATGIDLRKYLTRYRYSDFILNLGGGAETRGEVSFKIQSILNENPNAFLGHGRLFQKMIPEEHSKLQAFYAITQDKSSELVLTSCWFSDSKIKFKSLGYGLLDIVGFPNSEVSFNIYFNTSFNDFNTNKIVASSNRFEFCVGTTNLDISNIVIRLYDSEHKSKELPCEVINEGNNYVIRSESLPPSNRNWEVVAISCTAKNTNETGLVRLSNCTGIQKNSTATDIMLINETTSNNVIELVNSWESFILDGQSKIGSQQAEIYYSDFKSDSLLLENIKIFNNNEILLNLVQINKLIKTNGDNPIAAFSFRGYIKESVKKIRLSVEGLESDSMLKLRICRQGVTEWQYIDFDVENSIVIGNPFTKYHEGMRIEIRTIVGVLNKKFKLKIDFPESKLEPKLIAKPEISSYKNLDANGFKSVILALEENDTVQLNNLFQNQGKHFSKSLIKALAKNDKWKWLVPTAVSAVKLDYPQDILPMLVYFDPVHRNTASATQELRKSLLTRYPDNLVTIVHPSWEKEGQWEVTVENETNYSYLDDVISDIAASANVKLIVRTGFLGEKGVDLYSRIVSLDCDIYSYVMDTWDLREKNSTDPISKKLLAAFSKLLNSSKDIISITDEMALHIKSTYSVESNFVVHNFIPKHFSLKIKQPIKNIEQHAEIKSDRKLMYLYSGGLEEDMTYGGLLDFVGEVGANQNLSSKVKLVIKTFKRHQEQAKTIGKECKKIGLDFQIICKDMTITEYNKLVATADVFFIPYVESEASKMYVKNSFPNKFSDYLCHQKPIVYFGPRYAIARIIDELDIEGIYNVYHKQKLQLTIADIHKNYEFLCNEIEMSSKGIIDRFGEAAHLSQFYGAILNTLKEV